MLFSGAYEHTIDSKNRLAIPSQVRETLDRMGLTRRLFVAAGTSPGTLALWPEKHFLEMARQLPRSPIPDPDQLLYEQLFFSAAYPADIDNQGRILIPERLVQIAGIGKQVVITGVYDHLEICNKQDFDEFVSKHWQQYPQVQQNARQAILKDLQRRTEREGSEWKQ